MMFWGRSGPQVGSKVYRVLLSSYTNIHTHMYTHAYQLAGLPWITAKAVTATEAVEALAGHPTFPSQSES